MLSISAASNELPFFTGPTAAAVAASPTAAGVPGLIHNRQPRKLIIKIIKKPRRRGRKRPWQNLQSCTRIHRRRRPLALPSLLPLPPLPLSLRHLCLPNRLHVRLAISLIHQRQLIHRFGLARLVLRSILCQLRINLVHFRIILPT
jgi:hypothetical protein